MAQANTEHSSASRLDHYAIDELRYNRLMTVVEAVEGLARLTHDGKLHSAKETAPVGREALSAIFQLLANELSSITQRLPLAEPVRH
ncbi:MAG: hypothetical protein C0500_10425 [Sphingobium sp.]|nr:hypothetical protein [Sphingobium sp.]